MPWDQDGPDPNSALGGAPPTRSRGPSCPETKEGHGQVNGSFGVGPWGALPPRAVGVIGGSCPCRW